MSETDALEDGFDALLEEGQDALDNLESVLGDADSLEDLEGSTLESVLGDIETLAAVATETEELLEAIDFSNLPDAVDGDDLLAAIDAGEIPDALTDADTGVGDVVDFTQVFRAIDLLSAWDATDLGAIWEEKRELEDAVDDIGDGGLVETAADAVSGEGDDELVGDDGLIGDDDMLEDADPVEALGDIDVMEDPEAYQVAIQQGAMAGIDAFREALLETHATFNRLYQFNREKMRRQDTSPNSRNPTAASTMPTERAAVGSGVKHATVPQDVHLSTAPSRRRIYGQRFERERQRRRRR
ncbi:hypothetical protein D8Y22_17095 [Salinadaptatus halalkaliphilus]|uniref:Uncharacterized protein n=1 Tax=Salinadaptatus halalkaliphilus TaxID=2419781 RepID=A0A4S3TM88_9EURY|nr:hypothetical protein [Salinadaptatus halalkaliphilus]THE63738.1 hypothetical protein D8Y22_17095 [Salinadaptatus halalkaliphilus]